MQLSVKVSSQKPYFYRKSKYPAGVQQSTVRFGDTPLFNFTDKLTPQNRLALQTQILEAVQQDQLEKAAALYVQNVLNRPSMEALKKDPNAFKIRSDAETWYTLHASLWKEAFGTDRPKESLLSQLTSGKWRSKRDLKSEQDWETKVELQKRLHRYLYNELLPSDLGQEAVTVLRQIPYLPVIQAAKLYKNTFLDINLDEYRNDPTIPPQYVESRAFSGWLCQCDELARFVQDFDAIADGTSFAHSNDPLCLNGPLPVSNRFLQELGPTQVEQRDPSVLKSWQKDLENSRLVAEKVLYLAGSWHYDKIQHQFPDEDFVLKFEPDFITPAQRKGFMEKVVKHFPGGNNSE